MGSTLMLSNSLLVADDMPVYVAMATGITADALIGGAMATVGSKVSVGRRTITERRKQGT